MESSSLKFTIISGVFALLGSGVTGYFLIQSNQVLAEKDIKLKTSEIVHNNHDVLRVKAEAFMDGVYDFFLALNSAPKAPKTEITKAALKLQKKAMALAIYSNSKLGKASLSLAAELSLFPDSQDGAEATADKVVAALGQWYKEFYIETSGYNLELMPEKTIKTMLLQHFMANDG